MFFFNLSLILTFIAQTSETFCSDGFTPLLVVKCDIENVYIEVNDNCRKAEFSNIQWGNKEAVVNGDENFIVDVTAIDDDSACIPKQIATADFTGLKFTIPIDQCSMDKTVDDENIIHTLYK